MSEEKFVRQPVSKRLRFEVFKRDGFACQYCGAHPPGVLLHCDHIVPVAAGGLSDIDNLVTACEACNLGKGAVPLNVVPESLADKAARVAEAEEQLAGYNAVLEAKRDRIERQVWQVVFALTGQAEEIARDRFQSIKIFVEKLGVHEVIEAAEIATASRMYSDYGRFKYFCGVCWNKIREGGHEG